MLGRLISILLVFMGYKEGEQNPQVISVVPEKSHIPLNSCSVMSLILGWEMELALEQEREGFPCFGGRGS